MDIYSVTSSPWSQDENLPWDYDADGLVRWVDEVFLEGYKKDNEAPFPSLSECLDILEGNGYSVEVK